MFLYTPPRLYLSVETISGTVKPCRSKLYTFFSLSVSLEYNDSSSKKPTPSSPTKVAPIVHSSQSEHSDSNESSPRCLLLRLNSAPIS